MKLGYIGLGKMGMAMVERLLEKNYEIVANNRSSQAVEEVKAKGAIPAFTVEEVVSNLESPRLIWLMVPHQAVDGVLEQLVPLLSEGDTVIDGGNSFFEESVRRHKELADKGIKFLDAGVSGGPGGARNGACVMVGGDKEIFAKFEQLFKDISLPDGYKYMGKGGAGHFVKMVHNGIEYGMMQAIAEGFAVMKASEFNLNLEDVTDIYQHGSVIESRLVGWMQDGFKKYGQDLSEISGKVSHSGEGLWTVETAKKLNIPVPIIEGSLQFRVDSQGKPSFTGQLVSTMRNMFGGHSVKKED